MATPFSPIVYHAMPNIKIINQLHSTTEVFDVEENSPESDSVNSLLETTLPGSNDLNNETASQNNADNLSTDTNIDWDVKKRLPETILPYANLNIPIIGYEIMEERARFTVFKCHVQTVDHPGWFVFRRYTDFTRLQKKLKMLFPGINLHLPPKRWFGDNFDPIFLDDRLLKLQTFINSIIENPQLCQSKAFIEFFCMEDSLEAYNNFEEDAISCSDRYATQVLCDVLERKNQKLQEELEDKKQEIKVLNEEKNMQQQKIQLLQNRLREMYLFHG